MAVRERNGSWQADFKLAGWSRVRETFTAESVAQAYELECRAAHVVGKPRPPVEGTSKASRVNTLSDLLEHCRKMRWNSKKSGEHLAMIAELFVAWAGPGMPVATGLTNQQITDYVEYRQDAKSNTGSTINRHLAAISVLMKAALKLDLIVKPLELPRQQERQGRIRYYSDEEETMMFGALIQWGFDDYHDLFVFLIDTGARLGEAEKLAWVDVRGRSVSFIDTKGGGDRSITATDRVAEVLQRMRLKYGTTKGPFSWLSRVTLRSVWDRLRAHFHEWMGEDTVVHTFRHTCCSRLVIAGVDLTRVKTWMGHKRFETTLLYAHLAPKHLEVLADVLNKRNAPGPRGVVAA